MFNIVLILVDAPFFLQVKELNHVLEAEKSCRTDLEMYVAVLNTQKSVLQEDAEKLRKELHDGTIFSFYIYEAVFFSYLVIFFSSSFFTRLTELLWPI